MSMFFLRSRQQRSAQRGVAAVEMAIILLPMLILCFGITELGRALYQYNGLVKATRGAARYLSQQNLASPPVTASAINIRARAQSLALCGALWCRYDELDPPPVVGDTDDLGDPGVSPLVVKLEPNMIAICDPVACDTHANVSTGQGTLSLVSVTITGYEFTSIVPWVIPSITFGPIATTMASSTN